MSSSKTIGIIGGGQLGQMMAISAIYMGHKVITLDPAADCPASRVAKIIVAPYNDVDALRQLAERCDVLTYEFENVDADGLDAVIKDGQLPQGTDLLRISQNRIFEKDFLANKAQVTVAPYKVVTSSQDLAEIDLSKNYVLKTATGGYDGHGQKVIRSEADLEEAFALADSADCVLEEFVNFDLEISVIVSGNGKDVTVFPVQENIHRNNILSKTIVPARISASLAEKAKAMAVRIAEQLNLSGTLCVEMFATADDIIVNEIAPAHTTLATTRLKPVTSRSLTPISWVFSEHHCQLSNCMRLQSCSMFSASMSRVLKSMSQKIQAPTSTCMVK